MKIIGGKYRGRALKSPKGRRTRPTSARLREALFNIVDVEGLRIWDLFAGTGAIGLEALSRGAKSVTFVEIHPETLKKNIALLGERCRVLRAIPNEPVDLIFADPPYGTNVDDLLKRLAETGAHIFLEIGAKESLPAIPDSLTLIRERHYGAAKLLELR